MSGKSIPASKIASDALRRFPTCSIRKLAMYLCEQHKGMFTNYEQARTMLRTNAGLMIRKNGQKKKSDLLQRDPFKLMPFSHQVPREPYILPAGRWGILSDVHVPFHEIKPLEIALDWFRNEKITGLILGGDVQDCSAISYWPSISKRDFPAEVEATIDFLDMLRQNFPRIKIVWQDGNHEDRLTQYYNAYAPQLAHLPTSDKETILGLGKRRIEALGRKRKISLHRLTLLHGHEMRGSYSVVSPSRWAILKAKACVAIGHFHEVSSTTKNTIEGNMLTAFSFGCVCDLSPDYNPFCNEWSWGAAILEYDGKEDWDLDNRKILPSGRLVT